MGASVLLMLNLRPSLMLTPTFCMEDMDTLAMLDTMDTHMPTMDTTESVLLMLSPRLMLILTFSMEDMDILDMPDTTDTLMLTTDITLDIVDTMDTPMVDMPIWDKL